MGAHKMHVDPSPTAGKRIETTEPRGGTGGIGEGTRILQGHVGSLREPHGEG